MGDARKMDNRQGACINVMKWPYWPPAGQYRMATGSAAAGFPYVYGQNKQQYTEEGKNTYTEKHV